MKKKDRELFEDLIKVIDVDTKNMLNNIDNKEYTVSRMLDMYNKHKNVILLDKALSELSLIYKNRDTTGLVNGQYKLEYMNDHIFGDVDIIYLDELDISRAYLTKCIFNSIKNYTVELTMAKMSSVVIADILLAMHYNKLAGCSVHGKMPSRKVLNTIQIVIDSILEKYEDGYVFQSYEDGYDEHSDKSSIFNMYPGERIHIKFILNKLLMYNAHDIIKVIVELRNAEDEVNKQVDDEDDMLIDADILFSSEETSLQNKYKEKLDNDIKLDMIRHSSKEVADIERLLEDNFCDTLFID